MRIRIEGRQPLRGTYQVSGSSNAAMALIAASMLSESPVHLGNIPDSVSVGVITEIAADLGAKITRSEGEGVLSLHAPQIIGRGLSREHTDALSATLLLIAPILARRRHARMTIDYSLSRLHPHLTALRDLGVGISIDSGVIDLKAAPWSMREVILTQTSVTTTALAAMMAAVLGEETVILNAASEPHITDLLLLLKQMGIKVEGIGSNLLTIRGKGGASGVNFQGEPVRASPDHIEAASVAALGALSGGRLTVEGTRRRDLRMIAKVYERLGVQISLDQDAIIVPVHEQFLISTRDEDVDVSVESAPWPGFPSDLIGMATVIATQAQGTVLIHEKLFNNRMLFVDRLNAMGAQIVLCDPHRAIVVGGTRLRGEFIDNPDVRIGLATLGAALCAEGETVIDTAEAFDRTFDHVLTKLTQAGANIRRIAE